MQAGDLASDIKGKQTSLEHSGNEGLLIMALLSLLCS
jgi:hypothetical protein